MDQHYMCAAIHHQDAMVPNLEYSDGSTSGSSPRSDYPELTAYSTAASFSLAPQCDSSLLTPSSGLQSPPLHHILKYEDRYSSHPETPLLQQLSPPLTGNMLHTWGNHHFDMNASQSQHDSPMQCHSALAPEYYMSIHRRTPGPPEPYMESYANPIQHSNGMYYTDVLKIDEESDVVMPDETRSTQTKAVTTPPVAVLPSQRRRKSSTQEYSLKSPAESCSSGKASPKTSPRAPSHGVVKKRSRKRVRAPPAPIVIRSQHQPQPTKVTDEEHTNCHGQEVAPKIKEGCPEQDRYIFELRWRHRHQRGKDMWDSIQKDFRDEFGRTLGKEVLQMKFKRGRCKYYEWEAKDEDLLYEAWVATEKERYQTMLDKFVELGGSRNMRLCPSDIEYKVVTDFKLEEDMLVETFGDIDVRRRLKLAKKPTSKGFYYMHNDVDTERIVKKEQVLEQIYNRRNWDSDADDEDDEDDSSSDEAEEMYEPAAHGNMIVTQVSTYPARATKTKLAHPSATSKTLYQRRRG